MPEGQAGRAVRAVRAGQAVRVVLVALQAQDALVVRLGPGLVESWRRSRSESATAMTGRRFSESHVNVATETTEATTVFR